MHYVLKTAGGRMIIKTKTSVSLSSSLLKELALINKEKNVSCL